VTIQGDEVGGYHYWIKAPEDFTRHFAEQRNRASFLNNICFFVGYFGFSLAALLIGLTSTMNHARPRRLAYWIALFMGILSLATALNYLPLDKIAYGTTQEYSQFWLGQIFSALTGALMTSAFIFGIWFGGERSGKLTWPRQEKILAGQDDRWAALARSTWRGLMLFGLQGAYIVIFYLVATRLLGGWMPVDIDYSNAYATPLPFLGPLYTGVNASISEETLFRLVGISLVLGLTRRRWLALLIPGALWAFAHLSYVRDPYYMRGLELLPVALVFGLVFLRFDLTTTIIAHLTYNATLGALPMLRSGQPYFIFSGLVVVLAIFSPLMVGVYHIMRQRLRGRPTPRLEPQVTPATIQDLSALQALPLPDIDWETTLVDPTSIVICLRNNEQVIGAATGRIHGSTGKLEQVYVLPEWRKRYLGSALSDAMCASLEERGASSIQADVQTGDHLGLAFLAGQGWREQTQTLSRRPIATYQSLWREWRGRLLRRQAKVKKPNS
jgi:GNAT superfamily N-acetyltransferase